LLKKNSDVFAAELDFEVVKNLITILIKSGTREVIFSGGGEPFLYPKIWEVLAHAQKIGLQFRINTNFTLLDKLDIQRLVSFDKLASLTVSIWAGDVQRYCAMHNRSPQSFSRLIHNLKILNTLRPLQLEVKVYAVINNINYNGLEQILDLASETKCSCVEFGVFDAIAGVTDKFLLNREQLDFLQKEFMRIAKRPKTIKIVNKYLFLNRLANPGACFGEYDSSVEKIPCYAGWLFLRVRANGDFNSCLKSHRVPIGNVYKDNFDDAWNGSKQQLFREKGLSLSRDEEYFRFMSNTDRDMGCRYACDNWLVNEHLHRFIKHLFWIKPGNFEKQRSQN
jgi:MoaA/NifB/PqqE/SkfB family radical SAM enzyme